MGSANSSNSNRLREVAQAQERAYMIDGPEDIRREWLAGAEEVGLTAGASAPEVLVQQVIARLREPTGSRRWRVCGPVRKRLFPLPKSLQPATTP